MKIFFTTFISIVIITISSCFSETGINQSTIKQEKIKKEFLNHEILNDSIHYKIKEYEKRNHIYRNLCVFNKETLLEESLIYKTQKKELMDEGYCVSKKRIYKIEAKTSFTVYDINSHFYNYEIESIDTTLCKLIVTNDGKIEINKIFAPYN
mgnify:CR=1 FL=1